MKKIIAIGDIHGRDIWEQITDVFEEENTVVFVGDYFDTRESISAGKQLRNFQSIVAFKKNNPERVHLLIGNHDFHYMNGRGHDRYSGFQDKYFNDINQALEKAHSEGLLEVCYKYENILFTHAGITETWAKRWELDTKPENIEKSMWGMFEFKPEAFRFPVGIIDPTGDDPQAGPLWVRPDSLLGDYLSGYHQVVGHTMQRMITVKEGKLNAPPPSLMTFIDSLHNKEYLEMDTEKNIVSIKKIK